MFTKSSNYSIFFTLPILIYFGYIFFKLLGDPGYFTGISAINTAIHEGGHAAVMMIGSTFLTVIAGTLLQLLLPIFIMVGFLRQRDYFGFSLGFAWLGINLFHISVYAGDAKKMNIPLLQFFGEGNYLHDWNYILTEFGILEYTNVISDTIYGIAILCFLFCFIYSGFLIVNRFRDGNIF